MAKKKYKSYLIVDGYNIINDWEELKILSAEDLDAARERLIHRFMWFQRDWIYLVLIVIIWMQRK